MQIGTYPVSGVFNETIWSMINNMDKLEYTTEQDKFFDYCLWEYKPVVPYINKFRSVNLLYHFIEYRDVNKRVLELIQAIRQSIGFLYTVWGVKQAGDDLSLEFYFYDYRRRDRERSMTRIMDAIRPFIPCNITVNENMHYFMFSIDINDGLLAGGMELEEIHMYIGNVGSTVSSGICYSLTGIERRLENFYFFFDAKKQLEEVKDKVFCSAYVDSTVIGVDQILWPELRNCKTICLANKRENDCIYFCGINVDQFVFFLKRMNYADELVSFVETNRSNLDHLQYDVGIDYRMEGKDLMVLKTGYYGHF